MEVWAHCPACNRWYFVASDTVDAIAAARCPVCDSHPDQHEDRGGDSAHTLALEVTER